MLEVLLGDGEMTMYDGRALSRSLSLSRFPSLYIDYISVSLRTSSL